MPQRFEEMALGKRPPADRPALMLSPLLTGTVPAVPVAADHLAQIDEWNLGANDRFGTCGPTSVSNLLLLVTTYLAGTGVRVTDEDIFDLYRRSGNPGFDPATGADDNGVIMQDMLDALLSGGIGGHKPVAFAKITPGDMDTLDKAIAIFGGVLLGVDLRVAQQSQTVWDYVSSGEWGGHAILSGRYSNPAADVHDRAGVVTWAEVVDTTRSFIKQQEDEAWVVIWPEHLGSVAFLQGVDQTALASAYEDLTGRPFPVTPDPDPDPDPTPVPDTSVVDRAHAEILRHLLNAKHRLPKYVVADFNAWLGAHADE